MSENPYESSGSQAPSEQTTAQHDASRPQDSQPTVPQIPIASGREQCGACGAMLAPDQRYCVECGQRRGQARVPFLEQLSPKTETAPAGGGQKRSGPRLSANAALIAGVAALVLALGVGVLIGRSANSEKSPAVQVVTVGGGSTGTSGTATTSETGTAATGTSEAAKSATTGATTSGKGTSATSKSSKTTTSKADSKPKAKVVKLGEKGKGAGYKKGKFTGEFFGEEEK